MKEHAIITLLSKFEMTSISNVNIDEKNILTNSITELQSKKLKIRCHYALFRHELFISKKIEIPSMNDYSKIKCSMKEIMAMFELTENNRLKAKEFTCEQTFIRLKATNASTHNMEKSRLITQLITMFIYPPPYVAEDPPPEYDSIANYYQCPAYSTLTHLRSYSNARQNDPE